MNRFSILVVEDEVGIRELIQLFLQKKGYNVLTAEDGVEAINIVADKKPEVILLDIEIPNLNGFEVCEQIRKHTKAPILFVSGKKDLAHKIKGLEIGGDDYITKPFDFNELEARIQAIIRRKSWEKDNKTDEPTLFYKDLHIHIERGEVFVNGKEVKLLNKEYRLLLLLAKNPDRIWTVEHLYDQIWGFLSEGSLSTVKVHISNLRKKIEQDPTNPKYIQTVRGFGYKFSSVK